MPPFMIYALPRSRTKWLSVFLTEGETVCCHEAILSVRSLFGMRNLLKVPGTGISETALAFAAPVLRHWLPESRPVVIRRKVEEVDASLEAVGVVVRDGYWDDEIKRLEEISSWPETLTVDYADLAKEETCRAVWDYCRPGDPFDRERWQELDRTDIQIDFAACLDQAVAHLPAIRSMQAEAKAFGHPVTIQEESWADFFRDGEAVMAEHAAEVMRGESIPYEPNFDLAAKIHALGMMQIMTARANGVMVGYLVFQVEPCFESRRVLRGIQTVFYVRPMFRGRTGLQLHAASRQRLAGKGVKRLTLRSGVRGVGQRQEALFRRLGARDDGHMFSLEIGE